MILCDQMVPHCWHIINNQDAVARSPKFLVLYKRAGQRVLINHAGDMLVRPSFIENSILQLPGGGQLSPSQSNRMPSCSGSIFYHFKFKPQTLHPKP